MIPPAILRVRAKTVNGRGSFLSDVRGRQLIGARSQAHTGNTCGVQWARRSVGPGREFDRECSSSKNRTKRDSESVPISLCRQPKHPQAAPSFSSESWRRPESVLACSRRTFGRTFRAGNWERRESDRQGNRCIDEIPSDRGWMKSAE